MPEATTQVLLSPAFWSAVAASCAAVSSMLIYGIHRRNLIESNKPEIVLWDWRREEGKIIGCPEIKREVITFNQMRNVGRGPALQISVNSSPPDGGTFRAGILFIHEIPLLASMETIQTSVALDVYWDHSNIRGMTCDICLEYFDVLQRRYETKYRLGIVTPNTILIGPNTVARGVQVLSRKTHVTPSWMIRSRHRAMIVKRATHFVLASLPKSDWTSYLWGRAMQAKERFEKSWKDTSL